MQHTSALALAALAILSGGLHAQTPPDILVTSRNTDEVLRFDGSTGAFVGVFASGGGLDNPVGLTFGPDDNLYVASADTNQVLRYDGATGAFLDVFATSAGLSSPRQVGFGDDGDLYVASGSNNRIIRYDGTTGATEGVFASGGGLSGPTSFTFGPGGDLYVVSVLNDLVKRYDGATGVYLGDFVSTKVNGPHDVAFGPDGRFYVVSAFQTRIRIFNPVTGAFLENYVNDPALSSPLGMQWDGAGNYYVVNQGANEVRRYDAVSGAFKSSFIAPSSGGLDAPLFMTFMQAAAPTIETTVPALAGVTNHLRVAGFTPGSVAYLLVGAPSAAPVFVGCGMSLDLVAPVVLGRLRMDESGAAVFSGVVPLALAGATVHLQALAPSPCEGTPIATTTF
jgi:WD40 repeat protein